MLGWRHWAGRAGTAVLILLALFWAYLAAVTLYPRLLSPFQLVLLSDCGLLPLRDLAAEQLVERRSEGTQSGALCAIAEREWLPSALRLRALRELRGADQPEPEALYRIVLALDPRNPEDYPLFEQALLSLSFNPDTPAVMLHSPELLRSAAEYACTLPPQLEELLAGQKREQIAEYLDQAPGSPDGWLSFKLGRELLPYVREVGSRRDGPDALWSAEIEERLTIACAAG